MKKLILLFITSFLFAIVPQKIVFDSYISKVTFDNKYLVTGLENGEIIIKNFQTQKNIYTIKLPKIEDFMGDKIAMPIYSLDLENNKLLILAGGVEGSRKVYVFDINLKKLVSILTTNDSIMRAKFIANKILFVYLSDELSLFNPKTKRYFYRKQIGNYVFSTWAISGKKVALGDESGDVTIANVEDGNKIEVLSGFNKDQTLSVDIYKNLLINGTSDKKVTIYDVSSKNSILELKSKFLPYGATVTKNRFAIQYDEKNNIGLYNFNKKMKLLKGHTMPLNGMKFKDEKTLISYSPAEILIWKLK